MSVKSKKSSQSSVSFNFKTQYDPNNDADLFSETAASAKVSKDKSKTNKRKKSKVQTPISMTLKSLKKVNREIFSAAIKTSKFAGKYIDEGMAEFDKEYNRGTLSTKKRCASHLLNEEKYTFHCEGLTQEPLSVVMDTSHAWAMEAGFFGNRPLGNGQFVPYQDRNVFAKSEEPKRAEVRISKIESFSDIRDFAGNLKTDFRFLSLTLNCLTPKIENTIIEFLRPHLNNAALQDVLTGIGNISKGLQGFIFLEPDVQSFETRHYVISYCDIFGWMDVKSAEKLYRIEMKRKMVISSLKVDLNNNSPHNIPLCEEIMLQVRKKENEGMKSLYEENGLFISANYRTNENINWLGEHRRRASTEHFFGDNACSVHMEWDSSFATDKQAYAMRQVGILSRYLQEIDSPAFTKTVTSWEFFKPLFLNNILTENQNAGQNPDSDERDRLIESRKNVYCSNLLNQKQKVSNVSETNEGATKQKVSDDSETNDETTKHIKIMKASFLARQHAKDLTTTYQDKSFITRLWKSSKSFSMVVLSPAKFPARNFVYILIPGFKVAKIPLEDLAARSRTETQFETCKKSEMDSNLQGGAFNRSTLPADLEYELSCL